MGYLSEEVEAEAGSLGVELRVLPSDEMEEIRDSVYSKFTRGNRTFRQPLCELLEGYESVHDPDGWKLLGDLLGRRKVVLFFELDSDPVGVCCPDGYSLQKIIGECRGFVFYVTDLRSTFLVCFTDHDMLLVAGEVSERLKHMLGE